MDNMNTATATPTTKVKLGDTLRLASGTTVRIVRISKTYVGLQDTAYPLVEGIEPWLFGFEAVTIRNFWKLYQEAR